MTRPLLTLVDVTSPSALGAAAALRAAGVQAYVHGRVYGLVPDPAHPTGWRLAGEADSIEELAAKLTPEVNPRG